MAKGSLGSVVGGLSKIFTVYLKIEINEINRSLKDYRKNSNSLKKQSDQGLRCLPFHQHLLGALMQ